MSDFKIEELLAKNGNPIVKINEYFVHSRYDPQNEADKYIQKNYREHDLFIIFGYGKGYVLDALLRYKKHNEVIVVIDPLLDQGILSICDKHRSVLGVNSKDIHYLDDVLASLDAEIRTNFNVLCTNNYEKIFPKLYKQLLQKVRDIQEVNRVNDNTLVMFAEKWQENLALNLTYMDRDTSLLHIKKYFDCPVVIASSGPSLSKQIYLLKKYRNNFVLISAGSTTNVLLENGINPDFIVTIDGGEPNYEHFKNLKINNSKLVYSFQNNYKIRSAFNGQAFICDLTGHAHITKYINDFLECELPQLMSGSTVANMCFSLAQYISTGPIAFVGQDLAYTDNLSHVKGHNHAKNITDLIEKKELVEVEGYFGDKVLTSTSMNSMRLAFERMILVQEPTNDFYNCTEGGAKIKGFKQLSFEEFLFNFSNDNIREMDILNMEYTAILERRKIISKLNKDLKNAKKLIKLYKEAINILKKDNSLKSFKAGTLKKLDKIDEDIAYLLDELPLDHILVPTVMSVNYCYLEKQNETLYQKFSRVKNQNLKFYSSSLEGVLKFCNFIEKAIDFKGV